MATTTLAQAARLNRYQPRALRGAATGCSFRLTRRVVRIDGLPEFFISNLPASLQRAGIAEDFTVVVLLALTRMSRGVWVPDTRGMIRLTREIGESGWTSRFFQVIPRRRVSPGAFWRIFCERN